MTEYRLKYLINIPFRINIIGSDAVFARVSVIFIVCWVVDEAPLIVILKWYQLFCVSEPTCMV